MGALDDCRHEIVFFVSHPEVQGMLYQDPETGAWCNIRTDREVTKAKKGTRIAKELDQAKQQWLQAFPINNT